MKDIDALDPLVEGYLAYLADVSRKARGTVRDVRCSLKRVSAKMSRIRSGVPLWKLSLGDFMVWLERERDDGTSVQSLAKYLSHVRGLLDYAWRSGRAERNVLDGFRLQDARRPVKPRCLTMEEARHLVESCAHNNSQQRRDRIIVLLLYGCGLRTRELCGLRVQDIDRERRELFVVRGKGDRQRHVPIPGGVYTELLAYLVERGGRRGPLFRTLQKRRPINPKEVCQVVREAADRAGLDDTLTPKVLRHSYATHLMDRGVDLSVIASLMGHRSPQETGVYLHVLGDKTQEAVQCLDPAGGNGGAT
jgi:site-specific recombinase XerD